jgi:plasmid maintenance system antidote protein VapI
MDLNMNELDKSYTVYHARISQKAKLIYQKTGLKSCEIARSAKIHITTLSKILSGKRQASIKMAFRLGQILDICPLFFIDQSEISHSFINLSFDALNQRSIKRSEKITWILSLMDQLDIGYKRRTK